jgi:type IV pilus assembly protein PilA
MGMEQFPLQGRYLRHFERMQAANRTWLPGWNLAAFLHSTGWFWYRRMYAWSILNLIAPILLLLLLIFVVQWFVPEGGMGYAMAAAGVAYLGLSFVLLPLYADSLYLYRLKRDGRPPKPPSAFTALGALVVIVVPAYIAYVSVQAQRQYAPRERASEGLSRAQALRTPVAEFYYNEGRLPGPQEAAKFTEREPLKFARSVGWDAGRRAIVVVLGERDGGKRFEIAALEKAGVLEWTCRTIDFDARYLPASCR